MRRQGDGTGAVTAQGPTLCFMAIIYAALTTLRQTDLKKIIAYSSIGHMNVAIVGLFSFDLISMAGSVILLLGHGIVSPALFISIGVLYDRFKTRLCRYYSGMALSMPLFSTMLFVFTLANLSLPSTVNFVGEFLVFQGTFDQNPFAAAVIATSLVSVGAYALLVCARATFGVPKPAVNRMCDLSRREFFICFPFRKANPPSTLLAYARKAQQSCWPTPERRNKRLKAQMSRGLVAYLGTEGSRGSPST